MLKPKYLEQLPDAMIDLYSEVETELLADMARRISKCDYWSPATEWQRQKLSEMGNYHSYVLESLSSLTGKSTAELKQMMMDAGVEATDFDRSAYKDQGLDPPPLTASKTMQKTLTAGLKRTQGLFKNLTKTTASTATRQFEHALDKAYLLVSTGAVDYNTAIRRAVKDLARQGIGAITYPSGHMDNIEVAVRRAVLTGINQTALQLQMDLADEMECDLVETTAHGGARPDHATWQGKVFSRSGKSKKYPDFVRSTGYGSGTGLGGWNCRHSFYPYFEGSPRSYSNSELKDYEAKKYRYNGKKITEYEASQQQRYIERQIRRWKRENVMMSEAGLDAEESAAKIRQWQAVQRDFVRQTGLKRQPAREQIGTTSSKSLTNQTKNVTLDDKDVYALQEYKTARSYQINDILRSGGRLSSDDAEIVRDIDQALDKLPEYRGPVYRSMDSSMISDIDAFWARYQPLNYVVEDAYTSTSTEVYDEGMDIQMIIQSKHGCDMRPYNDLEQEILFKRDSIFLVTKREGNTLWLTEI